MSTSETTNDVFTFNKVEVNPYKDSSWEYIKCSDMEFHKYLDKVIFDYDEGTLTVVIPKTVFVPDTEAQKDLKALLEKWTTEGKQHLIESLGCSISGNCSDKLPCSCKDILDYLGEEKILPTETYTFNLKDCTFYKLAAI